MTQVEFSSSEERIGGRPAARRQFSACRWKSTSRRQRGIAAVEMALLLPVFLILLALPLYFGRITWHYSVASNAVQDAARYLSSVPLVEMRNPAIIAGVVSVASEIVQQETAELKPGTYPPTVTILCDGITCGGFLTPTNVSVVIQMQMDDLIFSGLNSLSIPITAKAILPYVGK